MRIVGGTHRGRSIVASKGRQTRPTTDRVREAIFNILENGKVAAYVDKGASVLDVCAGSGALGLEALSRGFPHVTFIESAAHAMRLISRNADALGLGGCCSFVQRDVLKLSPQGLQQTDQKQAGLVFLDPPYGKGLLSPALESLQRSGLVAKRAVLVMESDGTERVLPAFVSPLDTRRYGVSRVRFALYEPD